MANRPLKEGAALYKTLLLILTASLFAVGCPEKYKTKEELHNEGVKLMNANNPGGAIVFFKNALEKDQSYVEARFQLARAYSSFGKFDQAEKEFQKVLRQNPASREVRLELARVHVQQAKPDEALKEMAGFAGAARYDADALELAGMAHALKGNYGTAVTLLKKALSANHARPTTAIALTRVYALMGNVREAKSHVSEILRNEPSNRDGLYILAELQTKEKDLDAAIKTYERIGKQHPSDIEAFFRKGILHIEKGDYDEALSLSQALIESFPRSPVAYRLKGMALFHKRNMDDAIAALQKSTALQPHPGAYYFLGFAHYYKNELEQALNQFLKVVDLNPTIVQARTLIAVILLKQQRTDDAIAEIRKVLEIDGENALAHNILGSAYMAKGMHPEGIREFNKAVAIDPKLADVHLKKGLFSLRTGKLREAETDLIAAVQVAPDVLNSRAVLASYYLRQKAYGKAIDILRKGLRGEKTDALFYNLIAEALARQNKIGDAIQQLQKAKEINPDYLATSVNLASLYSLRGDYDSGAKELKSALAHSPDNVTVLLSLAALYESRDNAEDARACYLRAMRTGKVEGSIALAGYHLRNREPDKARTVLDEALKKEPSNTLLYELKGTALLSQKKLKEALRNFKDMENIDSKRALPYILNTYIQMKRHDEALGKLREELKKNPERLDLMADVSRLYTLMGNREKAIENAESMIAGNPSSPIGYMTLAKVHQDNKEVDTAIQVLKKADRLNNVNPALMLGDLYARKKDYASALDAFRRAEKIQPDSAQAVFQQGALFHTMGRKKEAIAEYSRALGIAEDHVPTLNNLACLYAEDNREPVKALRLAARAYVRAPHNGAVLDTLGFVLWKNGKVDEGLKAMKKALELLPDNPSVYYHAALIYKEQGNKALAIENLQKALRLGDFPEAGAAAPLLAALQEKSGLTAK